MARTDMREWQIKRRERTRQLIELGGLVIKAGLVELADDDRAALYGAFLTTAAKLRGEDREQSLLLLKRKGKRAFEAEAEDRSGADQAANSASIRSTSRANSKRS